MEDIEKMLVVIFVGVICVLSAVAISFLSFDSGTPNGNGSDNGGDTIKNISPDTDLIDQKLEAPNWNLLMSDGEILELHSLRGEFVVVDLMQTGECIPCQIQTADLKDLYEDYNDRIEIISLSLILSDTIERIADYKADNEIPWYVGLDTNGVFGSYFNAQSVPTLIIIDDEGYFRWVHVGVWSCSDISATLEELD